MDLLGGKFAPWLFTPYFVGEVGGEVAGSMSYYTPEDTHDVGVVEFVRTEEHHRRKGIASILMDSLIRRFRKDGGQALYLCTANPVAGHLYEQHGFHYLVGDGMRYLAPGSEAFDETYLALAGNARVRHATWGDLPRLSMLYNHSEPRWMIKDYLTQSFSDTRYESHFVKLMRRVEGGNGTFLILENQEKRVVGAAVFERLNTFREQHAATLGFRICPTYMGQASDLLESIYQEAERLDVRTLQIHAAGCDEDQIELFRSVGFNEEARLKDRLRTEEGWTDLVILVRTQPGDVTPARKEAEYYGARKEWQNEEISN